MTGSWGCLPIPRAARSLERDWRFDTLPDLESSDSLLPYGLGRSYGDSCINSAGTALSTRRLNRFITFDTQRGILHTESGVTLDEVLRVVVPRGWFLPVLPGTRFVTLGGAVANDVHGKNHHHKGSFGCHLRSLTLLRSDGERLDCSADENSELFAATIGGLGLTGLVTSVQLQLMPIACDELLVEDIPFTCVEEFSQLSRDSVDWEYTVSWIDTFARKGQVGRGIFSRAKHAPSGENLRAGSNRSRLAVPFSPPVSLVNQWTVNTFNHAYFWVRSRNVGVRRMHYQPFFFPLDAIGNWNRIYGRNGFYQYQCVVPHESSQEAVQALLTQIHNSRDASFLAVLKEFGDIPSPGVLSFPRPGLTLALDFPNRGEKTRQLLSAFDDIVLSAGGALYPAKDARMSARVFAAGYPGAAAFQSHIDPKFSSAFWRRVQQ